MRSVWGIVAFVCLGLLVGGCDPKERDYFREGIGSDLYTADMTAAAELQNIYLDTLCRQATPYVGPDVPSCSGLGQLPNASWPLIVQAGMNDIDRRCDAYLAWLDQKKRDNSAILAEIGAIRVAVDALTNPAISPGITPIALASVAAAFGLATSTLGNVNALLLQVDHTTVQSVVFVNRRKFREDVLGLPISNKPIAVHALRSYLTICMPMTISANINSTVTVFEQAGAAAVRRQPLVSTSTIAEAHSARDRVTPSGTSNPNSDPAHEAIIANYNPKVHSIGFVQGILKKLCAPKSEVLHVTTKTNARIAAYQQSLRDSGDTTTLVTGKLNARQLGLIQPKKECATQQFENLYEVENFPQGISSASELMNSKLPKNKQLATNPNVKDVRARIADVRKILDSKLVLKSRNASDPLTADLSDQLTSDLVNALATSD
ncbi:hypothetical protein [Bradyrhizobium sp. WSM1743]|uniref:hypothetical protein n=1 Tax=Bradyrhizobium sp. WSM1743 TaxID=318996 RepID=UPI000486C0B4|nr:hypothetical protein [Bradyrhizobium sp. WSM1743]